MRMTQLRMKIVIKGIASCKEIELEVDLFPKDHVKIYLRDFSVRVAREYIFNQLLERKWDLRFSRR